jgi:hypothetical protein
MEVILEPEELTVHRLRKVSVSSPNIVMGSIGVNRKVRILRPNQT